MPSGKFEGAIISYVEPLARGPAISHRDNSKAPTEPVPGGPEIFSKMANEHGDHRQRLLKPARVLAPLAYCLTGLPGGQRLRTPVHCRG